MLAATRPRVLTVLSALEEDEKSGMLVNLGVSLARRGQKVLLVDARASDNSVGAWLNADMDRTLLDVARQQRTMQEAIKIVAQGLSVTMLSRQTMISSAAPKEGLRRLAHVFDIAVNHADLVVVDGAIDAADTFPLACLDDSELVIQVSADPATIKTAYGLIKRISHRAGRRSYSILVTGANEKEARLVFANMEQAAKRYLAVPLVFVGYVPHDEHVQKAAHLGRSVIDAFPLARASQAFAGLAQRLIASARSGLCASAAPEGVGLGM